VGNIVAVTKTVTHTEYVLDDGLVIPIFVWVWKLVGDQWLEQHEFKFVLETPRDLMHFTDVCRPFTYVFIFGNLCQFGGKKVVDATRVCEVTDAHEAFRHMLDIFVEHVFFTNQLESARGEKHEREDTEYVKSSSVQRRQIE
jgi:hypothetical protein